MNEVESGQAAFQQSFLVMSDLSECFLVFVFFPTALSEQGCVCTFAIFDKQTNSSSFQYFSILFIFIHAAEYSNKVPKSFCASLLFGMLRRNSLNARPIFSYPMVLTVDHSAPTA